MTDPFFFAPWRLFAFAVLLAVTAHAPSAAAASSDASSCAESKLQVAQVRCFSDAAKLAGDAGICERAKDPVVRFNCLSLYAEHTGDPAPCARIVFGGVDTQALRDACAVGVALKRREAPLCERAEGSKLRDTCYMMLVVNHGGDAGLCERISNGILRNTCTGGAASSE